MKRRFHFKKKTSKFKYFLIIIIIYLSFSFIYNILYRIYKINNESKIIENIISNTKNNSVKENLFEYISNPEYILKYTINLSPPNIDYLLPEPSPKASNEPLVYIYNTHDTETYDSSYLEIYNIKPDVKTISLMLSDYLKDYGIETLVEDKSISNILKENNWSYKNSYEASSILIKEKLENYPSLKLIIDLHRDSSPLTKTLLEYNNTSYAKILFVIGAEHNNYESNYNIALKLNDTIESTIPGISRGIIEKSGPGVNGIYNQDLNPNIVLIEIGGQYNEIEELNNTTEVLAKSILKYLEGE